MIQAIETQYKGYRFRSRLEARWAVFFDALNIEWEYEKEGYDLGKTGWYLPDFWLPKQKTFLEVKPKLTDQAQLGVYLAGKCNDHRNNWRTQLIHPSDLNCRLSEYPPKFTKYPMIGGFRYTGPFLIDEYQHSNGHSDVTVDCGHGYTEADEHARELVHNQSLKGIRECDVLFAWIDSCDCFGTLAEIGYAKALGKKILIAYKETLVHDEEYGYDYPHLEFDAGQLWFSAQMAERVVGAVSPLDALMQFYPPETELVKCMALSEKNITILVRGDPLECTASLCAKTKIVARDGSLVLSEKNQLLVIDQGRSVLSTTKKFNQAAEAARSARFEHGETPRVR